MKRGIVVYYNGADDKQYGFIKPDDASTPDREHNVFFHLSRQRIFIYEDGQIYRDYAQDSDPLPQKRDIVLFEVEEAAKGLRAVWWALEASYKEAQQVEAEESQTSEELELVPA